MLAKVIPLPAHGEHTKAGLFKVPLHVRSENSVALAGIELFLDRVRIVPPGSNRHSVRAPIPQEHRN